MSYIDSVFFIQYRKIPCIIPFILVCSEEAFSMLVNSFPKHLTIAATIILTANLSGVSIASTPNQTQVIDPIANCNDLFNIKPNGDYIIIGTIDCENSEHTPILFNEEPFTGSLHGLNNLSDPATIKNLTITGGDPHDLPPMLQLVYNGGLFDEIGSGATIEGLTLDNITMRTLGGGGGFLANTVVYSERTDSNYDIKIENITITNSNLMTSFNGTGSAPDPFNPAPGPMGGLIGTIENDVRIELKGNKVESPVFDRHPEKPISRITLGGLVGNVSSMDTLINDNSVDIQVNTTTRGRDNVAIGGLIGVSNGAKVNNNVVSGTIAPRISESDDSSGIGGFIGNSTNTTLYQNKSTLEIFAAPEGQIAQPNVGGLIGYAFNNNFIDESTAASDIYGSGQLARGVGGLIGAMDLEDNCIFNSYATGNIQLIDEVNDSFGVGGLVGYVNETNNPADTSIIDDSYSLIHISGEGVNLAITGGLVGGEDVHKFSSNEALDPSAYWNLEQPVGLVLYTSPQLGGSARQERELLSGKTAQTYRDWDTNSIWDIVPNSFPSLKWEANVE